MRPVLDENGNNEVSGKIPGKFCGNIYYSDTCIEDPPTLPLPKKKKCNRHSLLQETRETAGGTAGACKVHLRLLLRLLVTSTRVCSAPAPAPAPAPPRSSPCRKDGPEYHIIAHVLHTVYLLSTLNKPV